MPQEVWTEGRKPCWEEGYPAWDYLVKPGRVVSRVSCELVGVFVTCHNSPCEVNIYNGTNAQSPKVADLDAQANRTMPFLPPEPILCDRGLFFELGDDVLSVTVQWRPLPAGWRL